MRAKGQGMFERVRPRLAPTAGDPDVHLDETALLAIASLDSGRAREELIAARLHLERGCVTCGRRLSGTERLRRAWKEKRRLDELYDERIAFHRDGPSGGAGKDRSGPVPGLAAASDRAACLSGSLVRSVGGGQDALDRALVGIKAAASLETEPTQAILRALLYASQALSESGPAFRPKELEVFAWWVGRENQRLGLRSELATEIRLEAGLLLTEALYEAGRPGDALSSIATIRQERQSLPACVVTDALCDFHEGVALATAGELGAAERLLKRALAALAGYGQEALTSRVESALARVMLGRGNGRRALSYAGLALARLGTPKARSLVNVIPAVVARLVRGDAAARLGRTGQAHRDYVEGLSASMRGGLVRLAYQCRIGLAGLAMRSSRWSDAVESLSRLPCEKGTGELVREEARAGLYRAETFGRLAKAREMRRELDALTGGRNQQNALPFWRLVSCEGPLVATDFQSVPLALGTGAGMASPWSRESDSPRPSSAAV